MERIKAHKPQEDSLLAQESSDKNPMGKLLDDNPLIKQRKKTKKDEIDDIFGF